MYRINQRVYVADETDNGVLIVPHIVKEIKDNKYILDNNETYLFGNLYRSKREAVEARIDFHKNMLAYYEVLLRHVRPIKGDGNESN